MFNMDAREGHFAALDHDEVHAHSMADNFVW